MIPVLGALVWLSATLMAAPVLTNADVHVVFSSPVSCTVVMTLGVDAGTVEHRIAVTEGAEIRIVEIAGARLEGEPREVGGTRALTLTPEAARYSLRYDATQPAAHAGRCPLWIPTIATDGRGRNVRITVRLPEGATARGTMPSFEWAGDQGTATIGHLPAFVRVPYALPGEPAPWNVARIMDATAVATLLAATVAWTRRRGLAR